MFGFKARAFLKRLAKLLAEECEKPYSVLMGFIDARMSIALVRATNRCMRGSRTPVSNRFRWEGGAGLGLLKGDSQFEALHELAEWPTQNPNLVDMRGLLFSTMIVRSQK